MPPAVPGGVEQVRPGEHRQARDEHHPRHGGERGTDDERDGDHGEDRARERARTDELPDEDHQHRGQEAHEGARHPGADLDA